MDLRRELSDLPFAGVRVPHDGDLTVDGHYDGCHFTGGTVFTSARAENGHFMDCAFTEVTLEDVNASARAGSATRWLRDVRLLSVDLAATSGSTATFIGSRPGGRYAALDASLRRVQFIDCKLDSVNFRVLAGRRRTSEHKPALGPSIPGRAKLQQLRFPRIDADPRRLLPGPPWTR